MCTARAWVIMFSSPAHGFFPTRHSGLLLRHCPTWCFLLQSTNCRMPSPSFTSRRVLTLHAAPSRPRPVLLLLASSTRACPSLHWCSQRRTDSAAMQNRFSTHRGEHASCPDAPIWIAGDHKLAPCWVETTLMGNFSFFASTMRSR